MRVLKSLIVAGALAAAATSAAHAATYVAYEQVVLSGGAVQTGDFAAGTFSGAFGGFTGAVTAFTTTQAACGGNANVFCIRTGESSVAKAPAGDYAAPGASNFFKDGFLNLHADTGVNTVFQFIAPEAGLFNFAGLYKTHDVSPTGVEIAAYDGATRLFTDTFTGGQRGFDFDVDLAAGERVSFLLGAAGNFTYDSTGFALTVSNVTPSAPGGVPEPATWAMMILGFLGTGSILRHRRPLTTA